VSDPPLTLRDFSEMSVETLKGVGEKKAEALHQVGIDNVLDLLTHYPRRWIDRTNEARIRDLLPGEQALVLVTVRAISGRRTRGRPPKSLVTAEVTDGSGHMRVTFFNQAWRERQLAPGTQAALFGKLEIFNGRKQMTSPVVDLIGDKTGKVVPI
jgi:ATP-dependent DNA helicase RecG